MADAKDSRIAVFDTTSFNLVGYFGRASKAGVRDNGAFLNPTNVAVDRQGNIYVADTGNHRIRKISGGTITTIAGDGTPNTSGDGGPATSAQMHTPQGLVVDSEARAQAVLGSWPIGEVDISVRERTRSGAWTPNHCAIMPPVDAPATWAAASP